MSIFNYFKLCIMWFPVIFIGFYLFLSWDTQFSVFLPPFFQSWIPGDWVDKTPYEVLWIEGYVFTSMIAVITLFIVALFIWNGR